MKNKGIIKTLFFHESWDIHVTKNNKLHVFPGNTLDVLSRKGTKKLKKKFTFQADPFIFEKDNRLYIFYEAFNFRSSKGVLRCRILDTDLNELNDIKLEGFDNLNCHLSFPFLLTINGNLFMIPESSERKEVILFQSICFPIYWKQAKVLLSDIALTDNVLLSVDELYYLVSTSLENELVIHTATDIMGEWQKISPVLDVCNHHHRGAGSPYIINDKLYILTQECTPDTYGKSVFIKELIKLDMTTFKEILVDNIHPSVNKSDGIHTFNFTENYIVFDTKKNIFNPLSLFKKIMYRCLVKYRARRLMLQY
ncbi:hypothetical protein J2I14_003459 [Escherichia coli]|nr:hypothetical protein [Escherichia coli]